LGGRVLRRIEGRAGSGTGDCRRSSDESEGEQESSADPAAEREMGGRVKAGQDTCDDHESGEDEEHSHSIKEGEGKVVRSDDEQAGRVEPVEVVESGSSDEGEQDGNDECRLHGERVHRVAGERSPAAHQAKEQLREREDEHAAEDEGEDGGLGRGPGGENRRGEPDETGDKLAGESSQEGRADVALGVGDLHGFIFACREGGWGVEIVRNGG